MPEGRARLDIREVVHLVATILLAVAGALAACSIAGLALRDGSFPPLLISACLTAIAGLIGRLTTKVPSDLNYREGFVTVGFAWVAVGVAGALPFYISGATPDAIDALFESFSGFTTTGATILPDIESIAPGLLLWRSLTQWLGGMGIIVLGVAILPYLGVGGMQLFRAEVPGPTKDRLRPRIRETARILWIVYFGLTVAAGVLYYLGGMSPFDAVNHALTTLPTGGFSTHDTSMAGYGAAVQWTAIVFMYLGGINFTLHFRAVRRGGRPYWADSEWRLFSALILLATVAIAITIRSPDATLEEELRAALFHVVSIITTSGYATLDYLGWPGFAKMALFLLFFVGGMAGSTAGGPKVIRVLLIAKHGLREMRRYLHPNAVLITKVSGRPVHPDVMLNVFAFMILYVSLFALSTLAMAALGSEMSFESAAGAAASAISNIGPGLDQFGPAANYAALPLSGKWLMMGLMLAGRLEIYTVLLLFHPGLWRR